MLKVTKIILQSILDPKFLILKSQQVDSRFSVEEIE